MLTIQTEGPHLASWLNEQRKPHRLRAAMEKERQEEFIRQAEEKGFLSSPDEKYLLEKCGQKSIDDILLLNLTTSNLRTIGDVDHCVNLCYIDLSGNFIAKFDGLENCPQLIKLDLHNNQISSLPPPDFWKSMENLKILYLHDNSIGRLESLQNLGAVPCLFVLTLFDTPISLKRSYRHHVVNSIWSLKALDFHVISDEEIIEDAKFGGHFSAMNPAFYFNPFQGVNKDNSFKEEARSVFQILSTVSQIQGSHSPVLIIQRYIRGFLARRFAKTYASMKIWASVAIQRCWRKYKGLKYKRNIPKLSRKDSKAKGLKKRSSSKLKTIKYKQIPEDRPDLTNIPDPRPGFVAPGQGRLDFDTYLKNRRPGSVSPSLVSEHTEERRVQTPKFDQVDQGARSSPASRQKANLWIDLNKLEAASQLVPIISSRSAIDAMGTVVPHQSFLSEETTRLDKIKSDPAHPRKKKKEAVSVKQMLGKLSDSDLDRERSETPAEDEEPRIKFRISGLKSVLYKGDYVGKLYLEKRETGRDIRSTHKNFIDKINMQPKPKVKRKKKVNANQRLFARIHGTMGIACLRAVQQAYKDREKAEMLANKVDYVLSLREQRDQARERRLSYLEEKRIDAMRKQDRDSLHIAEAVEQKKSQQKEETEKRLEKRLRDSDHKRNSYQNQVFTANFTEQHTSISKALLKHDRHTKSDDVLRGNQHIVKNEREQQRKQGELVQRYLEHRKLMRQAQVAVERAALDTKLLQDANENLMDARSRVASQRQKVKTTKPYYPLPRTATDPILPAVEREGKPDRWNTLIMMYEGRVGNHPSVYGTAT